MRFSISRTSIFFDDDPPCEDAVRFPCVRVDERTTDDPSKIKAHEGDTDWWTNEGRNHRIEDGHIKRDFDGADWYVEIENLEALIAFGEKYGALVLRPSFNNNGDLCIEIYDSYRE